MLNFSATNAKMGLVETKLAIIPGGGRFSVVINNNFTLFVLICHAIVFSLLKLQMSYLHLQEFFYIQKCSV